MKIVLPKKCPLKLKKKVVKTIGKIESGRSLFKKTQRYGYFSHDMGDGKRLVLINSIAYVFNEHRVYEKFINAKH